MADVFYPSCKVRMFLRFEDFVGTPVTPSAPAGPGPETFGNELFQVLQPAIVPFDASVTLNSYREADQASVTLPLNRLPIDPRIVRAAGIQIFMGTVDPTQYAEDIGPIGGQARLSVVQDVETSGPNAGLSNEVFRGFVDTWKIMWQGDDAITLECRDLTAIMLDATMPVQGLAGIPKDLPIDEVIKLILLGEPPATSLPAQQRAAETASSRQDPRGNRRRLKARLDAVNKQLERALARAAANPGDSAMAQEVSRLTAKVQNITAALTDASEEEARADAIPILAKRYGLKGARGFQVVNGTNRATLPSLAELHGAAWFDSKGTPRKSRSGGSKERVSYWDFITDLVVGTGFIVYVRNPPRTIGGQLPPPQIVISEPRTYYEGQGGPIREFFYGKNVESIEITRRLTGKNAPTAIEVSATVAETGRQVFARFPPREEPDPPRTNRASSSGPSGGDKEELETILYGFIPQRNAQENLQRIAESFYEQRSRGEFEITIRTPTLAAFPQNFDQSVADLFYMRAGDTVRLGVAVGDPDIGVVTSPGVFNSLPSDARAEILERVGMSPESAIAAANASDSPNLQDFFRVRSVGIDWSWNQGFDFEIQAINYLDARNAFENVTPDGGDL